MSRSRSSRATARPIVLVTCNIHASRDRIEPDGDGVGVRAGDVRTMPRRSAASTTSCSCSCRRSIPTAQIMITDYYRKYLGTRYEGGRLPWLYHHYVGHDNNRDWFMLTGFLLNCGRDARVPSETRRSDSRNYAHAHADHARPPSHRRHRLGRYLRRLLLHRETQRRGAVGGREPHRHHRTRRLPPHQRTPRAGEVRASGTACASSRDILGDTKLTLSRSGSELRIEAETPDNSGIFSSAKLDFDVTVPDNIALRVEDGSGDLTIDTVAGVDLTDGSGDIDIRNVIGDLSVHDGSGDMKHRQRLRQRSHQRRLRRHRRQRRRQRRDRERRQRRGGHPQRQARRPHRQQRLRQRRSLRRRRQLPRRQQRRRLDRLDARGRTRRCAGAVSTLGSRVSGVGVRSACRVSVYSPTPDTPPPTPHSRIVLSPLPHAGLAQR